MDNEKQLYIIVSQTGTILSRILKLITKAKYNHSSISLDPNLEQMYSFGRKYPHNPFWGGFVKESPRSGTFKRFKNTQAIIMSVDIDADAYEDIEKYIHTLYSHKRKYHYNYFGVAFAAFKKDYKSQNRFYCSEFVKHILERGHVDGAEKLPNVIHPIDFLQLPHKELYRGSLKQYDIERKKEK